MPDSPDVREIFEGGDRKWGSEICKRLRAEGLGVPVVYKDIGNKKVDKIDLRQPGDKDESYRILERSKEELLGIILPVDRDRNEFVYISAGEEQGVVFQESDEYWTLQYKNEDG